MNTVAPASMRRKIANEVWEQIKTAYAVGIGLREIARKMGIPEGTVLAHAKRHGWTQQIHVATRELSVMQSNTITPVQSVPQWLPEILAARTKAAEQAAQHPLSQPRVGFKFSSK
jgi:hypothetical protein